MVGIGCCAWFVYGHSNFATAVLVPGRRGGGAVIVTPDVTTWLLQQVEPLGRLLLAAVLGAVLGAEREARARPAGLRTNTLIALGSALFTLVSLHMVAVGGGDATRIPAQVVTGIGFLGAGAILRNRGDVVGMTTAATIWVNAAIGMAAGAGLYALAITATVATLIVLVMFLRIEAFMGWTRHDRPVDRAGK